MNPEELKHELRKLFGEQIIFNKEFDRYILTIKNIDVNLIEWCHKVKENEIEPLKAKSLEKIMVFVKRIGSSNRCIVLKIMNGEFKEIHLGDHRYYNHFMEKLGLKNSSKTY